MTIIQSYGISHPKLPFQWGAGTLSVMGVSFTTVPIAQEVIPQARGARRWAELTTISGFICLFFFLLLHLTRPCLTQLMGQYGHANSCIPSKYYHQSAGGPPQCAAAAFNWAWGKLCGTAAFCSFVPMAISFLDFRIIKRLFPPIVIGPVIMLIGEPG